MKKLIVILLFILTSSSCFALDKKFAEQSQAYITAFFTNGSYVRIYSDNGQTIYVNKSAVHILGITETDFVIEYNNTKIKASADDVMIMKASQFSDLSIMVRDVKLY